MGAKYYTHFVLTGESEAEAEAGSRQEFSGVVEVNQTTETRFEPQEIEALLARNFDLDSNEVCLINWSRLQLTCPPRTTPATEGEFQWR
jgi:hypothetical protein